MLFAIKSSFKFPALATPNEVDHIMKDWWGMTSLQEYMPKNSIPMLFAIKSSFKFPALATPNEVDHVMKDWWGMTSLQEYMYLKALYFYFACLTTALLRQLHSVCFLLRKTYHHYWKGFCDSWLYYYYYYYLMSRPIQKPRSFSGLTHGQFHWASLKWEL